MPALPDAVAGPVADAVFDLVLRGGTVVDGTGSAPFPADVAVVDGQIAAVGPSLAPGARELDATGLIVTPGFVDGHSHLDGAVTWEQRLHPCSGHGITATVMGNCGVGFAPCRPEHRDVVIDLMEGVEDIDRPVLEAGLPWTWASYPEYLDVVAGRSFDLHVAGLLPHSNLRIEVMGERALTGEPPTAQDLAAMTTIARDALLAGAVGIGTSKVQGQRTRDGRPSPCRFATEAEYLALATALAEVGRGVLQIAPEFNRFPDVLDELAAVIRVARETAVTVTFSLKQTNGDAQGWRQLLALSDAARAEGVKIHPQVLARPTGVVAGWESTSNRFSRCPTYRQVAPLPLDERVEQLRRPEVRAAILTEAAASAATFERALRTTFPLGDEPDYEPPPERSIAAEAARRGIDPAELLYDAYLARDGRGTVLVASGNYAEGNLDFARELLLADGAICGLGDGGAHSSMICDASATTSTIAYWTRDRGRNGRIPLELAVRRLSADVADVFGLADRGRIAVGAAADLNVIDLDRLSLRPPRMTYDLPGGGRRLVQDAVGYVATFVDGVQVVGRDRWTGALPGRLLRGT